VDFEKLGPGALRRLLDSIADGVLVVDGEGRIRYSNRVAAKMLGRRRADLVGSEFGVPLVAGDKEEIELHSEGGTTICELRVATSELDGHGLWLVSLRDVTDGVRTREDRERARRDAEAMAHARAALLNMVAHQFRSPLGVISGYISMMLAEDVEPVPEGWKQPLQRVAEKTLELRSMVNDILMSARLEEGLVAARPQPVDLRTVVRGSVRRASGQAQLLSAKLAMDLPPEPVTVQVDAVQIGIILDNLVNNALTYSEEAEPWVRVSLQAEPNGTAKIAVADGGIGIPPELQSLIFDRFRRVDAPNGPVANGTGLGLAIAKELARLNGGDLVLEESTPGQGSCFVLEVPMHETAAT
jgi:signal transduction histidine kinase